MRDVFEKLKGKGRVTVYAQGETGKLSELSVTIEAVSDEVVVLGYDSVRAFAVALDKVTAVEAKTVHMLAVVGED